MTIEERVGRLEERSRRLEMQNRALKRAAALAAALVGAVLLMGATGSEEIKAETIAVKRLRADSILAEEFRIQAPGGNTVIQMALEGGGNPVFRLMGSGSRVATSVFRTSVTPGGVAVEMSVDSGGSPTVRLAGGERGGEARIRPDSLRIGGADTYATVQEDGLRVRRSDGFVRAYR